MELELLTVKQVAELTNYSIVSIHRFLKRGILTGLRMPNGRKYMIDKQEVFNVLKYKRTNAKKFDLD